MVTRDCNFDVIYGKKECIKHKKIKLYIHKFISDNQNCNTNVLHSFEILLQAQTVVNKNQYSI